MRVAITGAGGNLGRKLITALLDADWCTGIAGLDRAFSTPLPDDPRVRALVADLAEASPQLRTTVAEADAVIHLAARNPYPDATWAESAASFDMTVNVLDAAARSGTRVVFASSNHVMGGYKETPLAAVPGGLTTDLPPMPGTRYMAGDEIRASTPYAVAKLMGERLCVGTARATGLTAVCLRIGWCQPGDNRPSTIAASGTPNEASTQDDAASAADYRWFRNMWLSNRDLIGAVTAALLADASRWPAPAVVVNTMSANAGMPWDIGPLRDLLGYVPQDDSWRTEG